ncbi:hypothetical protein ScalyP_jg11691, partial [Parmales sp. scaly parma]
NNPLQQSKVAYTKPLAPPPNQSYQLGLSESDRRDTYCEPANGPRSTRYFAERPSSTSPVQPLVNGDVQAGLNSTRRGSVKIRTAMDGNSPTNINLQAFRDCLEVSQVEPAAGMPSKKAEAVNNSGSGRDRTYTNSTSDLMCPTAKKPPSNFKGSQMVSPSKRNRDEAKFDIRATLNQHESTHMKEVLTRPNIIENANAPPEHVNVSNTIVFGSMGRAKHDTIINGIGGDRGSAQAGFKVTSRCETLEHNPAKGRGEYCGNKNENEGRGSYGNYLYPADTNELYAVGKSQGLGAQKPMRGHAGIHVSNVTF